MNLSCQDMKSGHCVAEWLHRVANAPVLLLGAGIIILLLMTGCGAPKAGLQPLSPKFEIGTFSLHGDFVNIDSLQPTLIWEAYTPPKVVASKSGSETTVTDISYELRVWQTESGSGGTLVYAKKGLKNNSHALEVSLKPSTKYIWSVRAHFLKDGHPRMTEWGMAGYLLRGFTSPNEANFRFETPAS